MPQTPGPEQVPAGVRQGGKVPVNLAHRLTLFISTILFTLHVFGFLYFYSFWYLLKFFFKIPPCLSRFKEKMEHGTVEVGLTQQSFGWTLWGPVLVCRSLAV